LTVLDGVSHTTLNPPGRWNPSVNEGMIGDLVTNTNAFVLFLETGISTGSEDVYVLHSSVELVATAEGQTTVVVEPGALGIVGLNFLPIPESEIDFGMATVEVSDNSPPPTNQPPVADAGMPVVAECSSPSGTSIQLDGSSSYDPDGDEIEFLWEAADVSFEDPTLPMPTGSFPPGETLVTLTVTDPAGLSSTDDVLVTVIDTNAPSAECGASQRLLWPPNHKMKRVEFVVAAADDCDAADQVSLLSVLVTSSEPDNGIGDGNTTGDVQGSDGYLSAVDVTSNFSFDENSQVFVGEVALRAERSGSGTGRTYSVVFKLADSSGNVSLANCQVAVPRSLSPPTIPNGNAGTRGNKSNRRSR
jgi:hypothetical protein